MKKLTLLPFSIFFFFIAIIKVNSLGIASDFLPDQTMDLVKGQSVLYGVRLQNPNDAETKVRFELRSEIAEVMDYKEQYILPPKSSTPILINITVPKRASAGTVYPVSYEMMPLDTGGGTMPIAIIIKGNFDVRVVKSSSSEILITAYKVGFIALFLIIVYNIIRKKQKK